MPGMKMTHLVTIEDIAQCRHGPDNDIDLEAVYGGRIYGTREKGLKFNPVYHDSFHNHDPRGQSQRDHNGNMNGVYLDMYETFPPRKDRNANITIPKETAVAVSDKDNMPALNGPLSDGDSRDTTIEQRPFKTMAPVLLGPVSHIEGKGPDSAIQNFTENHFDNQEIMNETLQTEGSTQNGSDIILSDLRTKKEPSSNYALLGYNNEGYIKHDDETVIDSADSKSPSFPGNDLQEYVTVNQCVDSSPSKSSISSKGSPKKTGKFVTQVSVHVIEYSEDPAKSVKLESFESEIPTDPDLTALNGTAVIEEPNEEVLITTQEENDVKFEILNESEQNEYLRTLDDSVTLEDNVSNNTNKTSDPKEVILQFDEEKNSQTLENSEIQSHTEVKINSESKSTNSSALDTDITQEKDKSDSHDPKESTSQTKLKSILANVSPDVRTKVSENAQKRTNPDNEIHEAKSVKFSKDTVFNENKPKKYKNERIDRMNLRNMYQGRISSDSAVAKLNPLYREDLESYDQDSLTDDEKVAYRRSLHKMVESDKKGGSLNTPTYMEKYLVLRTQGLKGMDDIETLPTIPVKDRLIQRTIRKKRRKLIIKWTLVVMTVIIITATATVVGVYLKNNA